MHELSIATSLVQLVIETVEEAGEVQPVEAVQIRVGDLSGVVVEALEFCWEIAARDTVCHEARLEIERVPAVVSCPTCGRESELESPHRFRCGHCGGPTGEVVRGRELDLVALEIADVPQPGPEEAHHSTPHP